MCGKRRINPANWVCLVCLMLGCWACGSDLVFTRYEVGPADPARVFTAAVGVVKEYYTRIHGGIQVFTDEENLKFETGYIYKRNLPGLETGGDPLTDAPTLPKRQKLYFRVLPGSEPVEIEMFARFERFAIDEKTERVEDADTLWKFVRQDREVEDLLFEALVAALMEKESLQ